MRSSTARASPLVGSVPFSATYFSINRRSKTAPDAGETTGCSGTAPETTEGRGARKKSGRESVVPRRTGAAPGKQNLPATLPNGKKSMDSGGTKGKLPWAGSVWQAGRWYMQQQALTGANDRHDGRRQWLQRGCCVLQEAARYFWRPKTLPHRTCFREVRLVPQHDCQLAGSVHGKCERQMVRQPATQQVPPADARILAPQGQPTGREAGRGKEDSAVAAQRLRRLHP